MTLGKVSKESVYIGYQEVLILTEDSKLMEQIKYGLYNL